MDLGESGGQRGDLRSQWPRGALVVWGTSRSPGGPRGVWGELGESGEISRSLGDLRESEGTSGSLRGPREVWGDLGESGGNLGSLGGPQGIWRYLWESEGLRDLGDHCLTERNQ